jgi:hypothetical protein
MAIATSQIAYTVYDLDDLRDAMLEARANMEDAWRAQSLTTAEEGFTHEQSRAAASQALEAERVYREAWTTYDQAKTYAINHVEDAEVDVTPLSGW